MIHVFIKIFKITGKLAVKIIFFHTVVSKNFYKTDSISKVRNFYTLNKIYYSTQLLYID